MTIPTPLLAFGIFLASLVALTALIITGSDVPIEVKYLMLGSATAALGGAIPAVQVGSKKEGE